MEIFGHLERFASDLYPYRWPITAGVVIAAVAFVALALRMGWHGAAWRHRMLSAAILVPVLAISLPLGYYTLSPLWQRTYLDEESPLVAGGPMADATMPAPSGEPPAAPTEASGGEPEPAAFEARITHRGMIVGADDFHFGRGDALLIETAPGEYTLRFEEFSVRNGPDLFVYLTDDPNSVSNAINLGDLKATDGNINYEIPPGTDISEYQYAIVWCRQFAVLFASAPLDPA